MCDCNLCRSLDLSVLVEILSRGDSDHCDQKVRQCQLKVNIMSNMLTKDAPLSPHLADYVLLIAQFLLDLPSLKTLLACSFYGVVKDRFSTKSESLKSATAILPMSSA